MTVFRPNLLSFAAVLLTSSVLVDCEACRAQENPPAPSDAKTHRLLEELKPGTSLVYKDPETGEIHLLVDAPEEMVRELQERILLQKNTPLFEIQKAEVRGRVTGQLVELDVSLRIDITTDSGWVRVPIGFRSLQLTDLKHTTEVPDGDAVLESSRLPEKSWRFLGRGVHELNLKLVGEISDLQNGRYRLRPEVPSATVSHLVLQLPGNTETIRTLPEHPHQISHDAQSGEAVFEMWGVSPESEISWAPAIKMDDTQVVVQPSGPADLQLNLETASLTVRQPLNITGGSLDRLHVTLPPGYESVKIAAETGNREEILRPTEFTPSGIVDIRFPMPVSGDIVLLYDFGLKQSDGPLTVTVQIPDVAEAEGEFGSVEFYVPVGLELDLPRTVDVRPKRVDSARNNPRVNAFGYQLLSHRSLVEITSQETEPYFSVTPIIRLEAERDNILMTARFYINTVRGSLSEVQLDWPELKNGDWKLLQDTRLIADNTVTTLPGLDPVDRRLTFSERMSGQFEIELQAFRPGNADAAEQQQEFLVFLPEIRSPAPQTTLVSIVDSDEFSLTVVPRSQQGNFPLLPKSRWPGVLSREQKPVTVRIVDSADKAVLLRVTPQQAEVRTEIEASVEVQRGSLHVSEKLFFDVRHHDLTEVTLNHPDVRPVVRYGESGDQLEGTPSTEEGSVTYTLPQAVRGRFVLTVDYVWSPQTYATGPVQIPLVMPATADEQTTVTVGTDAPDSLVVAEADSWDRVFSVRYPAAWQALGARTFVSCRLLHDLRAVAPRMKPRFIVLRSVARPSGLITSITGIFNQPVRRVLFSVPESSEVLEAFVGKDQSIEFERTEAATEGRYSVQLRTERLAQPTTAQTATIVVRTPLQHTSPLMNLWRPALPSIAGTPPDCGMIWILGQTSDTSLLYVGGQLTELGGSIRSQLFREDGRRTEAELATILGPIQQSVRNAVLDVCQLGSNQFQNSQIVVGTTLQSPPVLFVFSRQAGLIMTAIVSLICYLAFLRLNAVSLTTLVFTGGVLFVLICNALPGPGLTLLLRLLPGCVIAVTAGVMQRLLSRQRVSPLLSPHELDQTTIFTAEKPMLSDTATVTARRPGSADMPPGNPVES